MGAEDATSSGFAVVFYADQLDNPVLEAMPHMASGGDAQIGWKRSV